MNLVLKVLKKWKFPNYIDPLTPRSTQLSPFTEIQFYFKKGSSKKFLWASRLWVGRRKEPILGYVRKKRRKNEFGPLRVNITLAKQLFDNTLAKHFLTTFLLNSSLTTLLLNNSLATFLQNSSLTTLLLNSSFTTLLLSNSLATF